NGAWEADLQDAETGAVETIEACTLVNATGPWIGQFHSAALHSQMVSPIRLVQGSHVVVPRLFEHDRAYIFQNSDGRIVFAIPYEHDFTLIGTTDVDFQGDPADVAITQPEITYLCEVVSSYFREHVDAGS